MNLRQFTEEEMFNSARKIQSAKAREAYLEQACGDDPAVRDRVNALLSAYCADDTFLESPAPGIDTTAYESIAELPVTQIGPYKLLEAIGEGGMGTVYTAQQNEPIKRRVALKLIKAGMNTKQVIARFEAERQALAVMDHPNIAKVFDAGATESGRPYFVMELVKGTPITKFCDTQRLDLRQRLELFVQVCHGVQHAHQKGIIHRDLKPSNVMGAMHDDRPVSKVIDFGVAKVTDEQLTEKTFFTRFGQMVGTLEYMSPEQAQLNQVDVDTRSDIYSLGVILYELLTGEPPFDKQRIKNAAFDETLKMIREEEPTKPSTKISSLANLPEIASMRHTQPQRLSGIVRGELDWIVMKALEKDRVRRYETANGFANDIQRYLDDEAVVACPPSARYRFKKFARRNKAAIATGSMVAAALVIGIIGTTWQSIQASNQAARAEGNLDLALAALDAVYLDAIGEEKLLGEPLASPDQDGDAESIPHRDLSEFEKELLTRGLAFYDQFANQNWKTSRAAAHTARAYYRVALLQGALEERDSAEAAYTEAINRFWALIRNEPDNHRFHHELGQAYFGLARILPTWKDAERTYSMAENAITTAINIKSDAAEYYLSRSKVRDGLGDYRQANQDAEKATELAPDKIELHMHAARQYERAGPVGGRPRNIEKASLHCEHALELEPNNAKAHSLFGEVLFYVDHTRALQHLSKAIEIDPTYARAFWSRSNIYLSRRDYERGLSDADESIRLSPNGAEHYRRRAQFYIAMRRFDEAKADLVAAEERCQPGSPRYATLLKTRGRLHLELRDYSSAVSDFTGAIERRPMFRWHYGGRIVAYLNLRQYDKALKDIETLCEAIPGQPVYHHQRALLSLRLDDEVKYRQSCETMLNQFGETDDPIAANFVAWTGSLAADAMDDYVPAIALAEKAVNAQPDSDQFLNTLGAVLYRAGLRDEAIERLTQLDCRRETADGTVESSPAYTWYFLAMAHQQAGNAEQAREYLNKANQRTDEVLAERMLAHRKKELSNWDRQTTLEILRKEAEALVGTDDQESPDSDQKPDQEMNATNQARRDQN